MESKHFQKAHEIKGKLDAVLPAIGDEAKSAQFASAIAAEFPELSEADMVSLADGSSYEFVAGHFVAKAAPAPEAPAAPADPK